MLRKRGLLRRVAAGSSSGVAVPDDIADGDAAPRSAERAAGGDEHLGLSHDPYEYGATEYSIHGAAVSGQEWAEGEEVGGVLGCPHYHSMEDEKDAAVEEWLKGEGFIAATGALGTGGDYPGIVYVVHIGVPYGLIDFAQETGRGGRAGEEVDSIILLEDSKYRRLERQEAAELTVDELAMQRFIQTRECRRFAMSGYLDEEGQTCEEVGGRLCDCCGGGVADWTAGQVRRAKELQRFEEKMDEIQRHCGFCWAAYGRGRAEHTAMGCQVTQGLNTEQSEWLRQGIRVDRRCRDCWKCGISQEVCKGIERNVACRWAGVVPTVLLSWYHVAGGQGVLAEGGFQGQNISKYGKWLGLRAREKVQGVVVSNGMWVLWTMLQRDVVVERGEDRGDLGAGGGAGDAASTTGTTAAGVEVENEAGGDAETDAMGEVGAVVGTDEEDVKSKRERVVKWLGKHCIYCEVTEAPQSNSKHWYKTCYRSQGLGGTLGYEECTEWVMGMEEFRVGECG
ncbi:hypothetical protein O988_09786, partial [Pseudogymnoascus sp. VKM F-3808]